MNIVLITDSYPPEIRSASHLMQEMAEELRNRGHKITVLTSYPQYNLADDFAGRQFEEHSFENDIEVIRIRTLPHHKVNFIVRGISQLTMPNLFFYKFKKYCRKKPDIVLVYSPPLPLAIAGKKIKEKYRAKFILNIQDIFPQNAVDLGVLKSTALISFFERIEKAVYKSADVITAHSEGNQDFLTGTKKVPSCKVFTLHNWVDVSLFSGLNGNGKYRKDFGLENKFVFLFAGVIGPSQNLDLIIEAANRLKDYSEICFLFVGDGTEKEKLKRMKEAYGLKNIIFQPFVSKEAYPRLVRDSDVGLICLSSMNKTPVVPGKLLGYMAAGIPVVAFLNRESDGHDIIKKAECGYSAFSDDIENMKNIILQIYKEKNSLSRYGENGFNYVTKHFDRKVCIDTLEKLF